MRSSFQAPTVVHFRLHNSTSLDFTKKKTTLLEQLKTLSPIHSDMFGSSRLHLCNVVCEMLLASGAQEGSCALSTITMAAGMQRHGVAQGMA
jgi:hypothetical protein